MTEVQSPSDPDVNQFARMSTSWRALRRQLRERPPQAWTRELSGIAAAQRALTRTGEWVSGPSTIMSVLGVDRREVIHCRMVRWLFDPLGRHGIGITMLEALVAELDLSVGEIARTVCSTEVTAPNSRADLVIRMPSGDVVVEAKIDAGEQHLQAARLEEDWPDAIQLVFLTRGGSRLPATARQPERWSHLSWTWIVDAAEQALADAPDAKHPSATGARDAARAWTLSARSLT